VVGAVAALLSAKARFALRHFDGRVAPSALGLAGVEGVEPLILRNGSVNSYDVSAIGKVNLLCSCI